MKGAVLLFAFLAIECYCQACYNAALGWSDDCGENEFCFEAAPMEGYCEICPIHDAQRNNCPTNYYGTVGRCAEKCPYRRSYESE